MKPPSGRAGFTLVELMMVVAIIGILAAIAVPSFSKQIKRSRTAEAHGHLQKMWTGSVAYYNADHVNTAMQTVPKQFPGLGEVYPHLKAFPPGKMCGCRSATGGRCTGGTSYWGNFRTWKGLAFSMSGSFMYIPYYVTAGTDTSATFTASAEGDLECDNIISRYERVGVIDKVTGDVTGSASTFVINELE